MVEWSAAVRNERRRGLSSRVAERRESSVLAEEGIVCIVGASVISLAVVGDFSECELLEKISRLNASIPLSVACVRAILEEEEDDGGVEFARKGFSVGRLGAVLGRGVID